MKIIGGPMDGKEETQDWDVGYMIVGEESKGETLHIYFKPNVGEESKFVGSYRTFDEFMRANDMKRGPDEKEA